MVAVVKRREEINVMLLASQVKTLLACFLCESTFEWNGGRDTNGGTKWSPECTAGMSRARGVVRKWNAEKRI